MAASFYSDLHIEPRDSGVHQAHLTFILGFPYVAEGDLSRASLFTDPQSSCWRIKRLPAERTYSRWWR